MRFSTFHVGQRARLESARDALEATLAGAVLAEQLGFEVCWVAEHHFSRYGTFGAPTLALAAIAGRTSTIRLGTAVAVVPLHQPLRLAEDLAMLDVLSNGRLVAGVGPGFAAVEFAGFNQALDERRDRFFEGIEIIRQAWLEPSVTVQGRFFQFDDVAVYPKPIQQPHPVIVHAATKSESQIYAARLGRPILLGRLGDDVAHESLARYAQTRRELDHDEAAIARSLELCGVLRHIYVAENRREAQATALDAAGRYVQLSAQMGMERRLLPESEREAPEDLLERGGIVGTPDDVIDHLGHLHALGVRHLICWFDWGGLAWETVERSMRLFAREVMPHFAPRQAG